MSNPGRTWWGIRFLDALEGFTDSGRLQRGRGYCSDSRILDFAITDGLVTATVRGNVNPYYGVYKEPKYQTRIQMTPLAKRDWARAIDHIGNRADLVARLLMNEMPDDIESAFVSNGAGNGTGKAHVTTQSLLPLNRQDFKLTDCSCPDYANPCKHIAGVYYRLARQLDHDPFLLFELRGLSREHLRATLSKTALGHALQGLTDTGTPEPLATDSYFTRPQTTPTSPDYQAFWHGTKRLPCELPAMRAAELPAILIRKGGDYPAFWDKDASFIALMEELYLRMREKNKTLL
ncbi:MAG: SWIM zinc finger family protein [Thiohalocapsa sp.]